VSCTPSLYIRIRDDHFQFSLVFIKKNNQINLKKNNTETKPKPVQTNQFWFGF